MAFAVEKFSHIAPRGTSGSTAKATRKRFSGGVLLGVGIAAGLWMVATFAAVQTIGPSLPSGIEAKLETSLGLNPIIRKAPQERLVRLAKFSRLTVRPRMQLAATATTQKQVAAVATARPAGDFIEKTQVLALARAATATGDGLTTGSTPVSANALVETVSLAEQGVTKPFNLVISEAAQADGLPDLGPLPLAKPRDLAASRKPAEKPVELAYARPGPSAMDDEEREAQTSFRGRKGTAYYDISAGVVYMPNGEKLEAHSGIGKMRDNPKYTHVKMKGPTPPGTYKVTMREALFHGVAAVRLTPTNGIAPLGRTGLLAHSYLLRSNPGDSHGCVAFADYPRFLKAFRRGEITHMVIVPSMKGKMAPNRTLASLFSRKG
jgi:hypothetical protein